MRLHTHTWGAGDRVALLVHGIMADHRTWRRVGPALAERGYRVVAVDLRGHGLSGRAASYTAQDHADDLAETLPQGAHLALGHSLGGLALSLAVERLAPRRAVYSDPAWHLGTGEDGFDPAQFAELKSVATRDVVEMLHPRWTREDVDVELEALALWDESSAFGLSGSAGADLLPAGPAVPSLVQLADPSLLVSGERARTLATRGFALRTVPGAGHVIHRDDFDGFMASLEGWI
ncbi:alpha/beta fold hydrolase [Streptomyces sp. NPDC007883]|uniref:alpha/beta fold hydrolase n=1 Tax=Streptomyces sp. NPDC007883 TaxID=3155116 RepID=UPI0033D971B2